MTGDMTRNLRICFIGDSFTQGVGDPEFRGWVGRVMAATWADLVGSAAGGVGSAGGVGAVGDGAGAEEGGGARSADVTVFNLGVRRNTSADVLARCWTETGVRALPGADNRLVLSVGANDTTIEDGRPRVEPEQCLANVADLLDGARERGFAALVVGPPPVADGGEERLARQLELSGGIAALCGARGVPFVDVTRALAEDPLWVAEALAGDGAHPGAGGYGRLAELVLRGGFREWLADGRVRHAAVAGRA
ncbi:GDSL-type esterase/lipase family protein [Kitasatospora sp. NPDC058406]|uniref:GDSL-type esterase/lipase family protein n=1 Tax=Kitasatospora sp. NPDC058406 TaxID=3346483 RepID=UPI0036540C24